MKVLVINCGSSSLKYQLLDMTTRDIVAKGDLDRIGTGTPGRIRHKVPGRENHEEHQLLANHSVAVEKVVEMLVDPAIGVIKSMQEIDAVGHRVLHGGTKFSGSVLVNDAVKAAIEECIPLGPLHNPANLMGIRACEEKMPGVPQVAVFDTAFHQTMPAEAYMYAIPMEYYEKYGIRKYGFHGTSHRYVSLRLAELMGKKPEEVNCIVCHLGNGSSISAVKAGKCIDTSMGLTPLDGLIMGTRSGTLDPAVVGVLCEKTGKTVDEVITMLNKQSGFLAIAGMSDNRDIEEAASKGDKRAALARDMLYHGVKHYIGAYMAELGHTDAIVFTAGIGENNPDMREAILDGMEEFGILVDHDKNMTCPHGGEVDFSAEGAKVHAWCISTNEELMIAMDTEAIVSAAK